MRKAITQREARRLRKECERLQNELDLQRRAWSRDWPGGQNICTVELGPHAAACIATARLLKHAVVAVMDSDGKTARFCALPLPKA